MMMVFFAAYTLLALGAVMLLVAAFRESILWGVACLLLPIVSLFFLIVHWREAKGGFFVQLAGLLLLVVAAVSARAT